VRTLQASDFRVGHDLTATHFEESQVTLVEFVDLDVRGSVVEESAAQVIRPQYGAMLNGLCRRQVLDLVAG